MDELEISGKRYISTRRAAKEHKYSADYIGQLIRAKKVAGQKVGRSLYVDEVSLADYLGKEHNQENQIGSIQEARLAQRVKVVEDEVAFKVEEEPVQVENKKIKNNIEPGVRHVSLQKNTSHTEVIEERAYRIPVSIKEKKGLVYLTDDEPLLPPIESKRKQPTASRIPQSAAVVPQKIENPSPVYENEVLEVASGGSVLIKGVAVFMIGAVICAVVVGFSVSISSHIIFEEGKTGSTQFSL